MMEDQLDKAKKGERRRKQQAETYQQLVFQQDLQHLWAVERKDGEIRLAMARKNSLLGRDRLQRDNEDKTTKQAKIRSSTKAREDRMWEQHLEKKDSLAQTHEEQMKAAQLRRDQKKEHEQERLLHAAENRKKLGVAQEQRATVRAAEEEERLMKLKEAFKKAKRQREEKQLVDDLGRKDMERRRLLLERQRQHHIAGKNKKYSSQTVKRVEKRDEVAEETVTPRMEHVAFEAESEKAETAYEDDYSHVDETSREEKVKANLTSTGAIMSAAGAQVEMGLADNQVPLRDGVRVIERKNQVVLQRSKTMSVRPRKPLRDLDTRPAWPPANVSCLLAVAADMTIPKPAALKVKAYPSGGMGPAGAVRRGAVGRQGMRRPRREEQEMLVRRLEDQQNRAWVHRLEEEQGREENRHEILRKTQDAGERAILEGIFASERRDSEDSLRKEQAYNEMHIAVAMEDAGLLADQQPRSTKLAPFR
jgi:DNA polymerase III alpha subunit (gram-positive type)